MRRLALPICLLLVALTPAGARAATAAERHSAVKTVACDATGHAATFEGSMKAYGRATGLQMRFTLQARPLDGAWARVDAPSFDVWLSAEPGRRAYVYDKQVSNLALGSVYRTVVRFRFRDAAGAVVAKATRRAPGCRQPDDRPNLLIGKITTRPAASAENRIYTLRVLNDGDSPVSSFSAELQVNGAAFSRTVSQPLEDGDETLVDIEAPRCAAGSSIIAGLDGQNTVDESDETDNGLTIACPA